MNKIYFRLFYTLNFPASKIFFVFQKLTINDGY